MTGGTSLYLGRDEVRQGLAKLHFDHRLLYAVWNKFFSRAFIERHAVRFSHYRTGEDFQFNVRCYRHLTRLGFNDSLLYKQRMRRPGSLTTIHFEKIENDRRPFLELWNLFEELHVAPRLLTKDKIGMRFVWVGNAASYALSSGEGLRAFRALLKKNGFRGSPVPVRDVLSYLRESPMRDCLRLVVKLFLATNPYSIFILKKTGVL